MNFVGRQTAHICHLNHTSLSIIFIFQKSDFSHKILESIASFNSFFKRSLLPIIQTNIENYNFLAPLSNHKNVLFVRLNPPVINKKFTEFDFMSRCQTHNENDSFRVFENIEERL